MIVTNERLEDRVRDEFLPPAGGGIRASVAWRAFVALAVCLVGPSRLDAQGGPPYYTNDPGTPGNRQWEINVGEMPLQTSDQSTWRTPDLDLNYGVGDRIQLTFEVAWLRNRLAGAPAKYGLSQDTFGLKWRWWGDEPGLAVSVFPQVSINNPTDSVKRGLVPPGGSFALPMQVSKQFGPIAINGELGYTFVQSGPNTWLTGVVAGHEKRIRHRKSGFEIDAEFYASGDVSGNVTQETLGGGFRFEVHPPFVLLAMAGRSLRHPTGSFNGYFGMQLLLPPKDFDTR